ncbi:MAG: hypothetical protein JWQ17_1227, partial [Tardiphaga sp.]|nr:hypothetical protein [Tardiphaga sp.]
MTRRRSQLRQAPPEATLIFNASAWLERPTPYPQTPRSEAGLR